MYLDKPGRPKPYQAQVRRGGKLVSLAYFATAEEAALCIARSLEGQEAAKRAAAAPMPLTSEEARQQAEAEGLTLLKSDNKAGYFGVNHRPGKPKPYQALVRRGGKKVYLGIFATAEKAALCIARSPEGQEAAKRPAAAPSLTSEEARQARQARQQMLAAAKRPAAAASLTSEEVGRRGAHSLKRKEVPNRWEHVLTAVGACSVEAAAVEVAEEAAADEEAEMELVEVVEVVGEEEVEEAGAVVVDVWAVVEAEEAEERRRRTCRWRWR